MGTNILEERMLEDTLTTFRAGGESGVSAAQGIILIDGWLQSFQGDTNVSQSEILLNQLRVELQATQPDSRAIQRLMNDLADQAQQAAEGPNAEGTWTGGLESLSTILRNFGSTL